MAIIGAAILANITNVAIMATMAWPNVVTGMVINGVYSKSRQNVDHT